MGDLDFISVNTHSSVRLETKGGTVVYVDPFGFETEPHDADLILITHTHYDHFSPEDIAKVRKLHTKFVMPAGEMVTFIKAGFTDESAAFLVPGESAPILPDVGIEIYSAYNVNKSFHPIDEGWMGYVVCFDGVRVYVAGDTDDLEENHDIECDVAMVPVGGTYTMDAREAAEFVNVIKPAVAIPIHYGTVAGSPGDGEAFARLVDPGIRVELKL